MSRAPSNLAFDDRGEVVPTVGFDFDAVEAHPDGEPEQSQDDVARARRETLFRLLHCLTTGAGTKRIGQRALVLAFLAGATPFKTQKELAAKLGVSAGRVSQILNSAKRNFAKLASAE